MDIQQRSFQDNLMFKNTQKFIALKQKKVEKLK